MQCMVRRTLIYLNPDEIQYHWFITSTYKCNGSFNTGENELCRTFFPNKMEGPSLKVFNIIKEINELKALTKYVSCECRFELDGKKFNSRQKWNNIEFLCECK